MQPILTKRLQNYCERDIVVVLVPLRSGTCVERGRARGKWVAHYNELGEGKKQHSQQLPSVADLIRCTSQVGKRSNSSCIQLCYDKPLSPSHGSLWAIRHVSEVRGSVFFINGVPEG